MSQTLFNIEEIKKNIIKYEQHKTFNYDKFRSELHSYNYAYKEIDKCKSSLILHKHNIKHFPMPNDFMSACTIIRPFYLGNENYYNIINSYIFAILNMKNNEFKDIYREILPKKLTQIKHSFEDIYKIGIIVQSGSFKNRCSQELPPKKARDFVNSLIIGNEIDFSSLNFFDLYLNGYIYHRDEDIIHFIEKICNFKNIDRYVGNKKSYEQALIYSLDNSLITILKTINKLKDLFFLIEKAVETDSNFVIEWQESHTLDTDNMNYPFYEKIYYL